MTKRGSLSATGSGQSCDWELQMTLCQPISPYRSNGRSTSCTGRSRAESTGRATRRFDSSINSFEGPMTAQTALASLANSCGLAFGIIFSINVRSYAMSIRFSRQDGLSQGSWVISAQPEGAIFFRPNRRFPLLSAPSTGPNSTFWPPSTARTMVPAGNPARWRNCATGSGSRRSRYDMRTMPSVAITAANSRVGVVAEMTNLRYLPGTIVAVFLAMTAPRRCHESIQSGESC